MLKKQYETKYLNKNETSYSKEELNNFENELAKYKSES